MVVSEDFEELLSELQVSFASSDPPLHKAPLFGWVRPGTVELVQKSDPWVDTLKHPARMHWHLLNWSCLHCSGCLEPLGHQSLFPMKAPFGTQSPVLTIGVDMIDIAAGIVDS